MNALNPLALLSTIDCRWLLEEAYFHGVVNTLQDKSLADFFLRVEQNQSRSLVSARMATRDDEDKPYALRGNVAVIALDGPLTKRFSWLSYYYGGTSTTDALLAVQQAADDPDVSGLLLLIDSPGGQVAGTFDLADEIAAVAAAKPVYAYVSDLCASAAYALGSQATQVWANRTALVGSIGTYMALRDYSKMYEQAGIQTIVIRAGAHKGAGTPGTAVTKEHLAAFQATIDALNQQFLQSVQTGRSLSDEQIAPLADGRVWVGQEACDRGLVDAIGSLDECLAALQSVCPRPRVAW